MNTFLIDICCYMKKARRTRPRPQNRMLDQRLADDGVDVNSVDVNMNSVADDEDPPHSTFYSDKTNYWNGLEDENGEPYVRPPDPVLRERLLDYFVPMGRGIIPEPPTQSFHENSNDLGEEEMDWETNTQSLLVQSSQNTLACSEDEFQKVLEKSQREYEEYLEKMVIQIQNEELETRKLRFQTITQKILRIRGVDKKNGWIYDLLLGAFSSYEKGECEYYPIVVVEDYRKIECLLSSLRISKKEMDDVLLFLSPFLCG